MIKKSADLGVRENDRQTVGSCLPFTRKLATVVVKWTVMTTVLLETPGTQNGGEELNHHIHVSSSFL